MSNVQAIFFDCFGVISDPVLMGWYNDYIKKGGKNDPHLKETLRQFDLGILSESDVAEYFSKYENGDINNIRKEIDGYLKINSSLITVIKILKQKGFKIGLLSNANHSFFDRKFFPENPDVKELFDSVVISSQVHMVKPNLDIYEYALGKLSVSADNAIMVDDRAENLIPAESLGMKGVLFTTTDVFIEQLNDLGISL